MRLRLAKLDEYQFLTCVKHNLWGSKVARFSGWKEGDFLALVVDNAIAGLGKVVGPPFTSDAPVWDNGTFPHRLPLEYWHVMLPEHRAPILGPIREALMSRWGSHYGVAIRNQQLLPDECADVIIAEVEKKQNDVAEVLAHIEEYLVEAKLKISATSPTVRKAPQTASSPDTPDAPSGAATSVNGQATEDDTPHSAAQYALIQLGKITGCHVWIAANDRNRLHKGKPLGEGCLDFLPNMGLSDEAAKKAALIDVIWLRQNAPVYAFEVETTTSIYSGILRMSDLLALVPALNIKLFIVAPSERKAKALDELSRPTFQRIGLSDHCRFISTEELHTLLVKAEGFQGFLHHSIVETIAISAGTKVKSALT